MLYKNKIWKIILMCVIYKSSFLYFRVDSIDFTSTPRSTFEKTVDGELVKISYIEYYKNNYGLEIKDHNQPLLISR